MRAWRIATDTPNYTSDDLTGEGAKITGGRWNREGFPVLYCADSPSLACMETVVHLGGSGLPLNRYLVAVEIPDPIWAAREVESVTSLLIGWDAIPVGKVSLSFGTDWLQSRRSAVLVVPSVIIPEDMIILVNPLHPDAKLITAKKIRRWTYDPRIWQKAGP